MKIGLALSGGGVRGIAHLGVLKALDEFNVPIPILSGTSAGAIVAAFYAYGYSPDEMLSIILKTKFYRIFKFSWSKVGLLEIDSISKILEKYMPDASFETLKKNLIITAADIQQGKITFFNQGELIKPVLASACIPGVFKPLHFKDRVYVDGGILNNLPTEPLLGHCDKIIGSHCNPINDNFTMGNVKSVIERSLLLAIGNNVYESKKHCDIFIEPSALKVFNGMEISKAEEIFEIGYKYSVDFLKQNYASFVENFK